TAEESVEEARLLDSGQQLVYALTQQCLAASWSGDHEGALRAADEAARTGVGGSEVWGAMALQARGFALLNAGRLDEGAKAVVAACGSFETPRVDRGTALSCCEMLAQAEAARGDAAEAAAYADRAARLSPPGLTGLAGVASLARAHAL